MTKLFYAASAAALLTAASAVPSLAQSESSGASGMINAPSITCRELSALDRENARGVIHYMSGFQRAMGSGMATQNQASGTSDNTGTTVDSGSSTNAGSADATGSTSPTGSTTGDASGNGSTAGSSATMAQLPGFQNIDVDRIMSECQNSPDMRVSDLMMQQSGSGSTAQ